MLMTELKAARWLNRRSCRSHRWISAWLPEVQSPERMAYERETPHVPPFAEGRV